MDHATRAKDAIMTHLEALNIDGVADSVYLVKLTITRA